MSLNEQLFLGLVIGALVLFAVTLATTSFVERRYDKTRRARQRGE